jgi:NAD(P)-dependent dehydrogenase (short-subunit alcohol dehydrogenase family)
MLQPPATLRRFTDQDQQNFAALSGDYNPIHMDELAARRTQAGACVVHGVQSLLWALEIAASTLPLSQLRAVEADFAQFLYLGEPAQLSIVKQNPAEARLELRVGETRIAQYRLLFGDKPEADALPSHPTTLDYKADALMPLALEWTEIAQAAGTVAFYRPHSDAVSTYPALCAAISAPRVSALLALTRLVGMASPGLHSTFHRISVKLTQAAPTNDSMLRFVTVESEPSLAVVSIAISAPGLCGTVKASRRAAPVKQPSLHALREHVAPNSFTGHIALVVGGSRGLGELAAKLLALAGAEPILTYANGAEDAQAVAEDIRQAGGRAQTMALNLLEPLAPQLDALPDIPSSMYFFATPRISTRHSGFYSADLYGIFTRFYVEAFHDLCQALSRRTPQRLQIFYPSTVFAGQPTKNMAEYAMAKAAGEVLAANMARFLPRLEIESVRLPRMATDQTAGMIAQELEPAPEHLAPIIQRVEQRAAASRNA